MQEPSFVLMTIICVRRSGVLGLHVCTLLPFEISGHGGPPLFSAPAPTP